MHAWRITSEDGSESRIVTGSGPVFPYREVAMCSVARKFGKYRIERIAKIEEVGATGNINVERSPDVEIDDKG